MKSHPYFSIHFRVSHNTIMTHTQKGLYTMNILTPFNLQYSPQGLQTGSPFSILRHNTVFVVAQLLHLLFIHFKLVFCCEKHTLYSTSHKPINNKCMWKKINKRSMKYTYLGWSVLRLQENTFLCQTSQLSETQYYIL